MIEKKTELNTETECDKEYKKETMVFHRILMEATDDLEPEVYKVVMQMILQYGLNGSAMVGGNFESALFVFISSVIEEYN